MTWGCRGSQYIISWAEIYFWPDDSLNIRMWGQLHSANFGNWHSALFISQLSWCMGYIADMSRRFFHPVAIDEMLATFVPQINGTNLDVCWKMTNIPFTKHDWLIVSEYSFISILPPQFSPIVTSYDISSHAVSLVGIHKFLQVRWAHVAVPLATFRNARKSGH